MANPIDFIANEYTVFEADQVLTNKHLNQLFNYLDQQNRWTRNKLIGIGIVCGLNIAYDAKSKPGIIEITTGCGVTSQGYLVVLEAPGAGATPVYQYTYYLPYTAIDQPNDLPFSYPGSLPFYKPYCAGKSVFLLLTDDEYEALEAGAKSSAKTISSAAGSRLLEEYVVVLFLEMNEKDLKNCDTFDCNNKGGKMQLTTRPLLVKKTELPALQTEPPAVVSNTGTSVTSGIRNIKGGAGRITVQPNLLSGALGRNLVQPAGAFAQKAPEINFKRFNVPYTDLKSTEDVITAFAKLVDDATLTAVAGAYNFCFEQYKSLLGASANPFTDLMQKLISQRDSILKTNPVFIQYFYDFIDDLIKAYYEFRLKVSQLLSACCPDENLFPLHLVLGEATANTKDFVKDPYRTYFIYSPLFARQENEVSESVFLFKRMQLLSTSFTVQNAGQSRAVVIKIQPTLYQQAALSQRAIPYYYLINEAGNELYKHWSYYKTVRGNAAFNLSYNAHLYNNHIAVQQPLLYDIERYDFFRVEGHIGVHYQTALASLLQQQKNYNLPFDIVAIAADQLPPQTGTMPVCNMQDLDTAYKLILSEFSCKVHTPFCFVAKFPFPPPVTQGVLTSINTATPGLMANIANVKLQPFSSFKLAAAENLQLNVAALAVLQKLYVKGDFLRKYCAPAAGTVGSAYLSALRGNVFTNPVQLNPRQSSLLLYYYIFEFIDSVEELMSVLLPNTLATLNMETFKTAYDRFTRNAGLLTLYIGQWLDGNFAGGDNLDWLKDVQMDKLMNEFTVPAAACIDERLQTLLNEYKSRLQLYQLQRSFYHYYNKHYGLEHKAGVPKGGTFVLVYHPAARTPVTTTPGFAGLSSIADLSANVAFTKESFVRTNTPETGAKLFMARKPKITPEKNSRAKEKPTAKTVAAANTDAKPKRAAEPASGATAQPVKAAAKEPETATVQPVATAATRAAEPSNNLASAQPKTTANASAPVNPAAAFDTQTFDAIKKLASVNTNINPDIRKNILDFLLAAQNQLAATPKFPVADNTVIADFYVPYLCCSDCAPVAYVITPPTPPDEIPEFDIDPKVFVFNDEKKYPFAAQPPVTDKEEEQAPFASPDIHNPANLNLLVDKENILYLRPAMPNLNQTLTAVVAYKNVPVTVTIIKPNAAFAISEVQNASGEEALQLAPVDKNADTYEWMVNEIAGLFDNAANPAPVSLRELESKTDATLFVISLTVSYTRNDVEAQDTTTQNYEAARQRACIDFEPPMEKDTVYGTPAQQRPGTIIFTTPEKTSVRIREFKFEGEGGTFNEARITEAPEVLNNTQCLSVNNINLEFDYSNNRSLPTKIEVDFFDGGGTHNLSVNGSEVFVGNLAEAPDELGGVQVTVQMRTGENDRTGSVTLTGKDEERVKIFSIGGQEFFIDNVCAQ